MNRRGFLVSIASALLGRKLWPKVKALLTRPVLDDWVVVIDPGETFATPRAAVAGLIREVEMSQPPPSFTAEELDVALRRVNAMLDRWNAEDYVRAYRLGGRRGL